MRFAVGSCFSVVGLHQLALSSKRMIATNTTLAPDQKDPRRWFTLAITVTTVLIAALDTTILNVAIPTILREFDTTLSSLQWVITGYSLTFAALLIIGGRLADIFGARRIFVIGLALFGIGSLIASAANGVPMLVLGEAIIEGMGASLMLPATMGILSNTFVGRERATAFAAWGATMGAAVAFGPLIGGFLTTNYSWRWGFGLNVIIVPFAIIGALLFMDPGVRASRRERIDVPGALLISSGMFMLVFGISEGGTYGWFTPLRGFVIADVDLWPASRAISLVPFAFLIGFGLLVAFYRLERSKEAAGTDPLFEFSLLRHLRFRYGLITLLLLSIGQVAFLLLLSVVLQDSLHLSALDTGLWLIPSGLFIVAGSQIGNRLTRRIGTTSVVRCGLIMEALGLGAAALVISPTMTLWALLPGFALFGIGVGFGGSQLTNVILSDIPPAKSGAASGANSTVRMIGAALGIAVVGSLFTAETTRRAIAAVRSAASLSADVRDHAIAQIHTAGVNFSPMAGTSKVDATLLRHTLDDAIAAGARIPLLFGTAVVAIGAALSFLIPYDGPIADEDEPTDTDVVLAEDQARREAEMMDEAVSVAQ